MATGVTRAAVSAAISATHDAPLAIASSVTDAAIAEAEAAIRAAATAAAMRAGADAAEAERIDMRAAAAPSAQEIGQAAAEATLAAVPPIDLRDARHRRGRRCDTASPRLPPRSSRGDSVFDDPQTLIPGIFALLAFLTVIGLGLPWLEPDIFKCRLKVITQRRDELSQQRRQRLDVQRPSLRRLASGRENFMRTVLEKLNFKNLTEQPQLKKKLGRAGYRSPQAIITFTFLRLALPLGLAGFAALLLFGSSNVHIAAAFKVADLRRLLPVRLHAAGHPGLERHHQAAGRDHQEIPRRARPHRDLHRIGHLARGGVHARQRGDGRRRAGLRRSSRSRRRSSRS